MAERGGQVAGVLPLARVKSWLFGDALVSLPFAVYGGAAVTDEAAREALHAVAVELARELGVQHLELRNRHATEPEWPRQDLYVTFRKQLQPETEANLLAIPRKQRAMVRKGIERGLTSEVDDRVDRFFGLYADNQQRHGTPPHPRRYFEALRNAFGKDCEVLTVIDANGRPGVVGAVVLLPRRGAAVLRRRRRSRPRAGRQRLQVLGADAPTPRSAGCSVFDYGRIEASARGSFGFKKNWGFEPQPLSYEYCLLRRDGIPQNNPSNPKYRAFIGVWRRLPRPVANALGPSIVRNLG